MCLSNFEIVIVEDHVFNVIVKNVACILYF